MSPTDSELDALTVREWSVYALLGAQCLGAETLPPSWLVSIRAEPLRPLWVDIAATIGALTTCAYLVLS